MTTNVNPPTLAIGIAFGAGANTNAWTLDASPFPVTLGEPLVDVFEDVTADVRFLSIERGRSRELDAFQAGRCSLVLDNSDREYDPLNLAGSHVSGGVTQVKPGRRIRVIATHPTTLVEYPLFQGTVRDWQLGYAEPMGAQVGVSASDAKTDLANVEVAYTSTAALSGAAFRQLMAEAGIARYNADDGASQLQSTAFDETATGPLRLIEQSEQGAVYVDPEGFITFKSRHAVLTEARSNTSQATFGAGDLDYMTIELDYDSSMIRNDISLQRTGGTAQTATDADSITAYGKRSHKVTGLMTSTDAVLNDLATLMLSGYAEPAVRVKSITVAPMLNAALMTQALSRKLRDRVTVQYQPPGGGAIISQEVFVSGISHAMPSASLITTTFTFESTTTAIGWVLGTSALGVDTVLAA
jgi:hypothetical protein